MPLRILSASGMYLRRRLQVLCNRLAAAAGSGGSRSEILNGFILRARKSGRRTSGVLIDPPVLVYVDSGVPLTGQYFVAPVLLPLPTGRDALSPVYKAVAPDTRARPAYAYPSPSPAQGLAVLDPGGSPSAHDPSRGNTHQSLQGGFVASTYSYLRNVDSGVLSPETRLGATCMAEVDFGHPVYATWALDPAESDPSKFVIVPVPNDDGTIPVNPAGMLHYFRIAETAFAPRRMMTRVVIPEDADMLERARLIDGFNDQPPMWVRTRIRDAVGATFRYLLATRFTAQLGDTDFNGTDALSVLQITAEFIDGGDEGGGILISVDELFGFDTAAFPLYAAPQPQVLHPDTTEYNALLPLSWVITDDQHLISVGRSITDYDHDPSGAGLVRTHPFMFVHDFNLATGAEVVTPIIAPEETVDWYETAHWFLGAVGIATDGVEVIYIGQNLGRPEEVPGVGDPTPRLGVIRILAGVVTFTTLATPGFWRYRGSDTAFGDTNRVGWEQTVSKFTLRLDQCSVDTLVYFGHRQYMFPVSQIGSVLRGPYDFSLAVYDAATGTLEMRTTLVTGLYNQFPPTGTPSPVRGVSLACVSYEVVDEDTGAVITPAVLLASIGNGRGFNLVTDEDDALAMQGKSWISYDSGYTWQQISDFGARAILYAGSITVRRTPMPAT